ncbi:hypothetical protein NQ318_023238 [Aromia moschata]|uniref:YqaJ viral recombinase domain-containing protein n=1 Tax=Aromia moschata TaxID=1265417 RepID=A0AAV8XMC8_9CUCU|nr:hypothetical protein NQ318_023238 [Aromia moschata]
MDDFEEEVFLSLGKVFSYLQATPESRCVVEGEALVNAKHIILFGTTSATTKLVQIIALCLQTSGVKNSPHEINGNSSIETEILYPSIIIFIKGRLITGSKISVTSNLEIPTYLTNVLDCAARIKMLFAVYIQYVLHGLKYEKEALEKYKIVNNYDIYEPGLIVCSQNPWLAYSPDGVVFADGLPNKLIEIKCPYDVIVLTDLIIMSIDNDAVNFVHTCNYLKLSTEEGLRLKQNHAYYGQVQMGMAILNLKTCDFIENHFSISLSHSMKNLQER